MLRHPTGPKLAVLCLSLALALPAGATQHLVIPGGDGIQAVIDLAAPGDTLFMLGQFSGPENRNLDPGGKDLVYLGVAGGTLLDGGGENVFRFVSGETPATVLRNLTLSGASTAILCAGTSAPVLEDLVFTGNVGTLAEGSGGGALRCEGSAGLRAERCLFTDNAHRVGGVASLLGVGEVLFLDCEFALNDAAWGGAVYQIAGAARFERCLFRWNTAYPFSDGQGGEGGALLVAGGSIELVEVLAEGNQAVELAGDPLEGGHGGFLCLRGDGAALLVASTVADNSAGRAGGALYLADAAVATVEQGLLAGNAPDGCHGVDAAQLAISCSDVFGDQGPGYAGTLPDATGSDGNIDEDPIFCGGVAPDLPFGLNEASPCLPAGNDCGLLIGRYGQACTGNMAVHEVPGEFETIQAAIDVAVDGDTVLVAPGIYRGEGNRALGLGGKAIVLRSANGSDTAFINCEGAGRAINCVVGETAATVIEGFTIYGGQEGSGGAVLCVGSAPTLRDLVLASNSATDAGGGAITCVDASPRLEDLRISNNSAAGDGGALLALGASAPELESVYLYDNAATGDGGALHIDGGGAALRGCTVAFNVAGGVGGGISAGPGAAVALDSTLVAFGLGGGGLAAAAAGSYQIHCSDVYGNTGGDWVGQAVDATGSDGNIALDPLFCDPPGRVLTLDADSPCLPQNNACAVGIGAFGEGCDLAHVRIGGHLADADGLPVADAIILGAYFEAHGADDGSYLIQLPEGWSGFLMPQRVGYVFEPVRRDYDAVTEDLLDEDYLALPTTLRRVPAEYPDIQSALTASLDGDTVLVAAGTYTGGGNKSLDFGGRDIVLIGESGAEETVIDCEQAGRAFDFDDGESPAAVVDGFTIRQGHVFYDWESNSGGGVRAAASSPTLRNLVIENCRSKGAGGGMAFADSESEVENVILRGNEAYGESTGRGGAVAAFGGVPSFTGLLAVDNVAAESGGGFYASSSQAQLTACSLLDNQAARGGGVGLEYGAQPSLTGILVAYNAAGDGSALHAGDAGSVPNWSCSDIFDNEGPEFGGQAQWPGGDNFDADPLFCSPQHQDFRVAAQSPCLAENNDCAIDVGGVVLGCTLTAQDEAPAALRLAQNHPNPFNPSTELRFALPRPERVSLTVFDLGGRRVATLLDDAALPAGEHVLRWTAPPALSSGVYLLRLRTGAHVLGRKLTLLK